MARSPSTSTTRPLLLWVAVGLMAACGARVTHDDDAAGTADARAVDAPVDAAASETLVCGPSETACGNVCVDTLTDPAHCGGCSNPCGPQLTCAAGVCIPDCGSGGLCDGTCIDTQTDPNHCGSCTTVCAAGQFCLGGACITDDCHSFTTCAACVPHGYCSWCVTTQTCIGPGASCGIIQHGFC